MGSEHCRKMRPAFFLCYEDDDMFKWRVVFEGPPDSLYEGGMYTTVLTFPEDFPSNPPRMRFLTEMWRPIMGVHSILMSAISMLVDPNINSPANIDSAVQLKNDPEGWKKGCAR